MSKSSKTPNAPKTVSRLHPIIHDIEPILHETDSFVLAETPLGGKPPKQAKGPIVRCVQAGALKQVGQTRYDGKRRMEYEWVEAARKHLVDYLDGLDKLPCECRWHIPDSRDDDEGIISCNHCGQEYDRDRFKELVLG